MREFIIFSDSYLATEHWTVDRKVQDSVYAIFDSIQDKIATAISVTGLLMFYGVRIVDFEK